MIYCEGKNCSRRDQCAYHELFEWKYPRQYLDCSTEGMGHGGIDKNGDNFYYHWYICGDNAEHYRRYKALGWREGQEYRNSEGTILKNTGVDFLIPEDQWLHNSDWVYCKNCFYHELGDCDGPESDEYGCYNGEKTEEN